ncbi:MAG: chloride channel protein [Bdellovibrionaceae bacterium]|nr:chloride channel protein [Pseudobdellovibrionaceae bacterium]
MASSKNRYQAQLESLIDRLPKKLADNIKNILSDPANYQTLGLWTSAVVAALVSVIFAKLFRYAEMVFANIVENSEYHVVFLFSPLFFVGAWLIVHLYAPEAAGSGIPQIMAANELEYSGDNKKIIDRLLSLRTSLVKIISAILCVLGGGAIGREGPTLQLSASIFHFFSCQVRRVSNNVNEHTWVVAGAASGLASAFNTPLGGIVYAIEELGLVHFHKVRTALISGVIVSGLVAQWILGSYLFLGFPQLSEVSFSAIPFALLTGLLTGISGALFSKILLFLIAKRQKLKKMPQFILWTATCGILMAGLATFDIRSSGTGIDTVSHMLSSYAPSDTSYYFPVLRFIGTIISYLSGAAGGIFSPSLTIGAGIGAVISDVLHSDFHNLIILLGMIGFLTGVTRTPFTSFILVLEMTDRHAAIFPMMMTAIVAQWIAGFVDDFSFYEHMKKKYLPANYQPPT